MHLDPKIEDNIDYQFIMRVQKEVTSSCAVPFAVPADRIPEYIFQAAQWFWQNDDLSVEERQYLIKNEDICKDCHNINKIIKLPSQIIAVHGVFKTKNRSGIGGIGDFSLERMMMNSYGLFGGIGGGGIAGAGTGVSPAGWNLTDVTAAMFEIDQFDQQTNPPLSYNYNTYSSNLVLLGDLGSSDLFIQCFVRCRIQDLYNNYYFFRKVVCLIKKALHRIYGIYEFHYPGGVSVNYSLYKEEADEEEEEIKEFVQNNRTIDFIYMPNTI